MTVKELREKLATVDGDWNIYLAVDEEGNGYGDLRVVAKSWVYDNGEDEIESIHPDDINSYSPDERDEALVLWP